MVKQRQRNDSLNKILKIRLCNTQAILQDGEQLKQEQLANLELISIINGLKRKQQGVIERVTRGVHTKLVQPPNIVASIYTDNCSINDRFNPIS